VLASPLAPSPLKAQCISSVSSVRAVNIKSSYDVILLLLICSIYSSDTHNILAIISLFYWRGVHVSFNVTVLPQMIRRYRFSTGYSVPYSLHAFYRYYRTLKFMAITIEGRILYRYYLLPSLTTISININLSFALVRFKTNFPQPITTFISPASQLSWSSSFICSENIRLIP